MESSESARNVGTPHGDRSASLRHAATGAVRAPSDTSITSETERTGTRPTAPAQEAAKEWIRSHETLALFSAFAVGVFIGTLMRS